VVAVEQCHEQLLAILGVGLEAGSELVEEIKVEIGLELACYLLMF
jgi:hypothetical protein